MLSYWILPGEQVLICNIPKTSDSLSWPGPLSCSAYILHLLMWRIWTLLEWNQDPFTVFTYKKWNLSKKKKHWDQKMNHFKLNGATLSQTTKAAYAMNIKMNTPQTNSSFPQQLWLHFQNHCLLCGQFIVPPLPAPNFPHTGFCSALYWTAVQLYMHWETCLCEQGLPLSLLGGPREPRNRT